MTAPARPALVAHADWSTHPQKRWLARAVHLKSGRYRAFAPEPAGDPATLIDRLSRQAGSGPLFLGFDFPIGLPVAYARLAAVDDFLALLPELGCGQWRTFYQVADYPEQISLFRPFYPNRPGGTRRQQLLDGLGLKSMDELWRRCELAQPNRRAATPLFWTLGAQQVGKAAIAGWREILGPAMRNRDSRVAIWPFAGRLAGLVAESEVVVAETYPAECYTHLGLDFRAAKPGFRSGKRIQADRAANGRRLLEWAAGREVELDAALTTAIVDGFGRGAAGEDPFDALVGLFGMLNVILGQRPAGPPADPALRRIEGWILGQAADRPEWPNKP